MSEWSGFFNAKKVDGEWDRTYLAENLAAFFSPLIKNGVFSNELDKLQVLQTTPASMAVQVAAGQAWISGYSYINTDDLTLDIEPADGALNRIDAIVVQWSNSNREIRLVVKKGIPASSPSSPTLQNDANIKELCLAKLSILAGLTSIQQQHIQDTRADSSLCGWVTNLISSVDSSDPLLKSGGTMTGDLDMGGMALKNLKAPSAGTDAATKTYVDGKRAAYTATLGTGWTGSGPYTQTVAVSGILAADMPHITPVYDAANATAIAQKEAWNCVSKAEAAAGGIKFTCFEDKPTTAIPIQIEVTR